MAPRPSRKVVKVLKNHIYTDLTLSKIMCPICRTILIEPVTLPCDHNFCLSCFDNTMANANLVCPLCRIRVGSWYRNTKKVNSLVNSELWKAIKEQFPVQVKNKVEGIDEIFDEEKPLIKIANPGEIRKEYENEKQIAEAELKKQRDLESKASEALIRKLTQEEELEKSVEEEKLRFDREIAKQIAKNLWNEAGPSSLKKKQIPLDRFLKKNVEAEISDSSDCIESECRYFKPIDYKSIPPSKALSPIKIPTKPPNIAVAIDFMGAPQGLIKFNHNSTKSAFTAIRCSSAKTNEKSLKRNGSVCIEANNITRITKRPSIRSDEVIMASKKQKRLVPSLSRRPSKLEEKNKAISPPFYGFEGNYLISNNNLEKRLQEEADLEFAKKLQEELNGYGRYSTRQGCAKKQVTIDEIIKAQCKVGL